MKGLIFSEPMVKAWMAGRKTVTRRLIRLPPDFVAEYACSAEMENPPMWFDFVDANGLSRRIRAPYRPGETVYIKETWKSDNHFEGGGIPRLGIKYGKGCQWKVGNPDQSGLWKSPRFMPEWASRSYALIKSVRPPERIREINSVFHNEILKEGWPFPGIFTESPYKDFSILWESLHPGSWGRNDWVWPIELEKQ